MTKRTRLFLFVATGILVAGLGTGLLASYMDFQSLVLIGGDGPAELAYVPPDAQIVAYADVRQVMDSELRQKVMQFDPNSNQGADRFQQETGIDIRTDVDKVVASLSTDAGNGRPLLLVTGRFDTARIESLIREKGGQVEDYQGKRLLTHPDGEVGVAFVEPGLVAVGTAAAVRRAIDTKTAGNDVTDNADVMSLVRDIDDGNAWAVARFDALTNAGRLPADVAKQLPAISWFAASGTINGGIQGFLRAEARDEVAANDLREVIRGFVALARMQAGQRAEFADLLNSLELGGQGKTVSLGFAVPSELIDAIGALHARRPRPEALPEVGPSLEQLRPDPSL
jgi:hypothetical protein